MPQLMNVVHKETGEEVWMLNFEREEIGKMIAGEALVMSNPGCSINGPVLLAAIESPDMAAQLLHKAAPDALEMQKTLPPPIVANPSALTPENVEVPKS